MVTRNARSVLTSARKMFQSVKPISVKSPREVSTPYINGNEGRSWQTSLVDTGNKWKCLGSINSFRITIYNGR